MKKNIFSATAALALFAMGMAMGACNSEENDLMFPDSETVTSQAVLTLGEATIDDEGVESRTNDNTSFSVGDRIGLYILDMEMNPVISNLPVSYTANGWDCKVPMEVSNYLERVNMNNLKEISPELKNSVYQLGYVPVIAVAYYPYNAKFDGKNPFAATSSAEFPVNDDLLISNPICINPSPGVETRLNLIFRHKFSCVRVNVGWPDGVPTVDASLDILDKYPVLNGNGVSYFCGAAKFATAYSPADYADQAEVLAAQLVELVNNANASNIEEVKGQVEYGAIAKLSILENINEQLYYNYFIPSKSTNRSEVKIALYPGQTSMKEIYVCPYLETADYATARASIVMRVSGSFGYDGEFVIDTFQPRWEAGKIYTYNASFKEYKP